jgi:hypothetical protein
LEVDHRSNGSSKRKSDIPEEVAVYQQFKVGDNNKVVKVEHDGCRTKCKGEQQGLLSNGFVIKLLCKN